MNASVNANAVKIAVLDDYQGVALQLADWSAVTARAQVVVFKDHLADADALVERLLPFDVVCVMRERTPLRRAVIERLPNLKLIASTAKRNVSIGTFFLRTRHCGPAAGNDPSATTWRTGPSASSDWATWVRKSPRWGLRSA